MDKHTTKETPVDPILVEDFLLKDITDLKEQLHDLRLERESFHEEYPPNPVTPQNQSIPTKSKAINTDTSK